ncbi:MAG: 3-methyl-2-oxobutanoate hydroxymethyltransferase [Anaerolineaceae bacterium]|nr:3-methyl-2-oxobutanoate hydroxymethyltransferase [Anaerolineaceae bacterium]
MKRMTVKDLHEIKKQRSLIQLYADTPEQAAACEAAGIEMVMTSEGNDVAAFRKAAPNVFLSYGLPYRTHSNISDFMREAYDVINAGADAVYSPQGFSYVKALADEFIPVWGHVGFVPHRKTWYGGFRAQAKTGIDALKIYELAMRYQDAGAVGIEVEIIPAKIAAELTKRLDILTMGMGAGTGCDGQYLFATDILGTNTGHIPRHAKVYRDHKSEYERLYQDSIVAFKEFRADVESGAYPEDGHMLNIKDDEFQIFMDGLSDKG